MLSIFRKDKETNNGESKSRSEKNDRNAVDPVVSEEPVPKYLKPKILLIDIKDGAEKTLRANGYNAQSGTLGSRYSIRQSEGYQPIVTDGNLPNYPEQEIVIVDLVPNEILEETKSKNYVYDERDFWGKCNLGVIDSRPAIISMVQPAFERTLKHCGVFIIFADVHTSCETVYAYNSKRYGFNIVEKNLNNWAFVSTLSSSNFHTKYDNGTEIIVKNPNTLLGNLLNRYIQNSYFNCTLYPTLLKEYNKIIGYSNRNAKSWIVTAVNKYNQPVAGVFLPDENYKGLIFIFPQIEDKANFLLELLRDLIPEFVPELFPYSESKNWIERDEYQSSGIQKLNQQKTHIEDETRKRIELLNQEIAKEKEKIEYQNRLLTDDDESLVKAVQKSLEILGFKSVFNVDDELEKQGIATNKAEDLQIRDNSVSILVEVKGVIGTPKDSDVFQVTKHVPIRMKEWKEFDVKALSIINHQKAIPALERNNTGTFRDLVLESAKEQNLGLMTTFDLYRLVRSFLKNNWKHENIKDIFLQSGHISIIPTHFQFVGIIENFWEKVGVVGVRIEENQIALEDTIAFELPIEFEEVNVESLQVENQDVEVAKISELAGIKTNLSKQLLKKGTKVFRVVS